MATQKISIVPNTTDPIQNLEVVIYTPTVDVVSQRTSIAQLQADINTNIPAQIADLQGLLASKQSLLNTLINAANSLGATDVTVPFTSTQVASVIAAGYQTPADAM